MIISRTVLGLAAGLSAVLASPVEKRDGGDNIRSDLLPDAVRIIPRFNTRNSTSDLDGFKGAILLKNGKQTSCEVALMDNTYAFVAANCLDYTNAGSSGHSDKASSVSSDSSAISSNGGAGLVASNSLQLNQTTQYTVMVSQGFTDSYATLNVGAVTPNSQYDPVSFANNVALLQFTSGSADEFVNYIASWRPEWTSLYYVRRSLNAATNSTWNEPMMSAEGASADNSGCSAANPLYSLNTQDLMCNTMETTNIFNSSCSTPYGSIYGVVGTNTAIAALYSHSAVAVDSAKPGPFCHGYTIYNYYIVLQHYIHWAMQIMGQKAPVFHSHISEYSEVLDPNYTMTIPSPKNVAGYTVYGGDLYNLQNPATETAAAAHKKISGGAIAGIVLALLSLLGLLAGYFIWRRGKKMESNRVRRWWFFGRFDNEEERKNDPNAPPREYMDDMEYAPHRDHDLIDNETVYNEPVTPRDRDNSPPHPLKYKDSEDGNDNSKGKMNPSSFAIEF
ncbi:hypothetical protein EV175_001525 [Coemansia sp. RSA 1933]|nr:hypothetical protein EV175_001525 [Coemansia sp. RSA 1933]